MSDKLVNESHCREIHYNYIGGNEKMGQQGLDKDNMNPALESLKSEDNSAWVTLIGQKSFS